MIIQNINSWFFNWKCLWKFTFEVWFPFQTMESMNGGKLFSSSYLMDLGGCITTLRYCAGWADKIQGRTIPIGESLWETTRGEGRREAIAVELNYSELSLLKMSAEKQTDFLLDFEAMQLWAWKFCEDLSNVFFKWFQHNHAEDTTTDILEIFK